MKMPTKREYSDTFNKILGLEIDWTKLKTEELVQLAMIFSTPDLLLKKLGVGPEVDEGQRRLVTAGVDTLRGFVENWDGPLARFVRKVMDQDAQPKPP